MPAEPLDQDCIFCRIISGEVPAERIFEDDRVLAFLDINPLSEGHTVVIPRRHAARLEDLPEEWAGDLGRHLGRLGVTLERIVGAAGYNVLQNNGSAAGQEIAHVHFHLIPRRAGDGLGYRWNAQKAAPDALQNLGNRVRAAL